MQGKVDQAEANFVEMAGRNQDNPQAGLILGDFYMEINRRDKAVAAYQAILTKHPDYIPALARLAEYKLNVQKIDESMGYTDHILKSNPKSSEGQILKGRIYLARREYNDAISILQLYVKDFPRSAAGHYYLGLAHYGNRDLQQTRTHLAEAVNIKPEWDDAQISLAEILALSGSYDQALAHVKTVLKAGRIDVRGALLAGQLYLQKNDLPNAERSYALAVKCSPNNPMGYVGLGRVHLQQKNVKEALSQFDKALQIQPNYIEALRLISAVHISSKQYKIAINKINERIKSYPSHPWLYHLLGQVYEAAGDNGRAEANYREAVRLNSESPELVNALGSFYMRQGMLDLAETKFTEAVRLSPSSYQSYMGLGLVCEAKNKYGEAKENYRKALEIQPRLFSAANNLAFLYAETGDNIDQALNLAQSAKESVPDDPYISDTLGWIYYKKNTFSRAIVYLREANEKLTKNATIRYHLGMAYLKNGNRDWAMIQRQDHDDDSGGEF